MVNPPNSSKSVLRFHIKTLERERERERLTDGILQTSDGKIDPVRVFGAATQKADSVRQCPAKQIKSLYQVTLTYPLEINKIHPYQNNIFSNYFQAVQVGYMIKSSHVNKYKIRHNYCQKVLYLWMR